MADREAFKQITLHTGEETASGVSDTFWVPQTVAVAYLDVSAASGSSPTLDVVLQEVSPADATSVYSVITWTQATAVTNQRKTLNPILGCFIRLKWTIGGTSTPTFTFAAYLQVKES